MKPRATPERQVVSLKAELQHSLSVARRILPPDVTLDVSLDPGLPNACVDTGGLHDVLLVLCTQAASAIKKRGRVGVTAVRVEVAERSRREFALARSGAHALIAIAHDGEGCGNPLLEEVREFLRLHEGTLHVQGIPGRGSCYAMWLPTTQEPVDAPGPFMSRGTARLSSS